MERGLRITRDDKLRRDAINRLMCDMELDKAAFGREWGIVFDDYFADALANLAEMAVDGLLDLSGGKVTVTTMGRIFLRNIAMPFDAHLRVKTDEAPRFSKTL